MPSCPLRLKLIISSSKFETSTEKLLSCSGFTSSDLFVDAVEETDTVKS